MRQPKILNSLLDSEYGRVQTVNMIYTIVLRYLCIKYDIKPDALMAGDNGLNCYIRFIYSNMPYVTPGSGWERLNTTQKPVEQYLKNILGEDVVAVQSVEQKRTHIYARNNYRFNHTNDKYSYALMAIYPKLVPWLSPSFDNEDKTLVEAILTKNLDKICEITDKLVDDKIGDMVDALRRKAFDVFKINPSLNVYKNLSDIIDSTRRKISELTSQLNSLYSDLHSSEEAIRQLSLGANNEDSSDLLKFFKQHKQNEITEYNQGLLSFRIVETFQNYSPLLEKYMSNNYTTLGSISDSMKKVIKYCLIDKKAKIRTYSQWYLTNDGVLEVSRDNRDGNTILAMPHPHLMAFACLGTNGAELNNYNAAGEWDMAIEQAIAATRNINIDDNSAVRQFISHLGSRSRFIEMPDGSIISPSELYEIIAKEERDNVT